jgi:hypothetical protein
MGQGLGDLMVLLRCGRMAAGLPSAAVFAYGSLRPLTAAYQVAVAPVVDQVIGDPADRARVGDALRAMSVKIGLTMLCYARAAGREPQPAVVALAGAVTRLYDDLIDGIADGDAGTARDDRLSDLFGARLFTPHGDVERLLGELVYRIADRVDDSYLDEAMFVALNTLHEYQCLSRRQREPDMPRDALEKITRGKGAMAHLVLCSLVKAGMGIQERELVMALGDALQSLDDYMDVEQDRDSGVTTLATLGAVTLADIGQRIRALRPRMVSCYGSPPTRRYCGMIYFLLLKSFVGRRLPFVGGLGRRAAGRSAVLRLLTRGDEALQPRGAGCR